MTTMNNVNRAMEIINIMAPMLDELNDIMMNLDRAPIDGNLKDALDNIYRDLNDSTLLYDLQEVLEEVEEIDDEQEEFELVHDPNDWDGDLDSYENLDPEELEELIDDEYAEVYSIIKPEYVDRAKQNKASYINTYEYHCMLVLRTIGVRLTYEQMCVFLEDAEQRHIDFDTKHPWCFTEQELIEEYKTYGL